MKIFLTFAFCLLAFNLAQAATINFTTADQAVVGEEIAVEMMIETVGENFNALESEVIWPADKLDLLAIEDRFSIISLWIQDPKSATATNGHLSLAGLVPNGYSEPRGQILTLVFRPRLAGVATITAQKVSVLLNDGQGTSATATTNGLDLFVKSNWFSRQLWPYLLFFVVGIIVVVFLWRIIYRKKFHAV